MLAIARSKSKPDPREAAAQALASVAVAIEMRAHHVLLALEIIRTDERLVGPQHEVGDARDRPVCGSTRQAIPLSSTITSDS